MKNRKEKIMRLIYQVKQQNRIDKLVRLKENCPCCGSKLIHQSGCEICFQCGYSSCDI